MMKHWKFSAPILLGAFLAATALAQDQDAENDQTSEQEQTAEKSRRIRSQMEIIPVYAGDELPSTPGAAHRVTSEQLDRQKTTDVHDVLRTVPGVYVQEEDAWGLRPNIGFRGAHPHRSKKITLMEDGILIGPAPYSSPAAYYFPMMENISGVEVFKGPSSTQYGPNSIGGALNLISRDFPSETRTQVEGSYGAFNTSLLDLFHGGNQGKWSWLLYGTDLRSTGFKELPNNENTGFEKFGGGFKLRYLQNEERSRAFDFRFNYTREKSHETYLGLSDADFDSDPYQRYAASARDLMENDHYQYQLRFSQLLFSDSTIAVTLYRHEFDRVWDKLNGFSDQTVSIAQVLADPTGGLNNYYRVLTGAEDSSNAFEELVFGENDRSYLSQGLQTDLSLALPSGGGLKEQVLDVGARLHEDSIERDQMLEYYRMQSGRLVSTGTRTEDPSGQDRDRSLSTSGYVNYRLVVSAWTLQTGVRVDHVESTAEDFIQNTKAERTDDLITPGAALAYDFLDHHQVFAGLHKGMNLVGPGQSDDIEPEEAMNYEAGYRYKGSSFYFETIGFLSDYSNIVGLCTFSSGCDASMLNQKFNGGEALITGVELLAGVTPAYGSWNFPLRLSLTQTRAVFDSEFTSDNPEWGIGDIQRGDPLPYIPELQGSFQAGVAYKAWLVEATVKYQGTSYDQSVSFDQAMSHGRREIPAFEIVDLLGRYRWDEGREAFIKINNIFDSEYLVSYRPFGARPGQPLSVIAGTRWSF